MATVVDSFLIELGLDKRDLDKGLNEADGKVTGFADKLKSKFSGALVSFLGIGAIIAQVKSLAAEADAFGKAADRMGAAVPDLYAWGNAAELSGGSAQGLVGTVERLNRELTRISVTGKSRVLPFLERLGVAATDETGKVRDTFEVLKDIAGSIEGMNNSESQGLLQSLNLDRGTITLLQSGRQAVDDLIKRQKELGYYTKEDTVIAAKFNDSIHELARSFRFIFLPVLRLAAPILTGFANALTDAFAYIQKHSAVLTAALVILGGVIATVVIPVLWGLFAAFMATPIPWIIALVLALIIALEDLWVYANGGESAFGDFWAAFGTGEEVLAGLTQAWEWLKSAASATWEVLKFILLATLFAFFKVTEAIAALLALSGVVFRGIGAFIDDYFIKPLKTAWEWITKIIDKIPSLSGIKATVLERWEQANTPIRPPFGSSGYGGGGGNSNVNQEVNINNVEVNTQATDASGIAAGIGNAVKDTSGTFFVNPSPFRQ